MLRHWQRGPHLRLNIRASDRDWTRVVQPAINEVIGGYLAAHPSTAQLDEAAMLPQHELLAMLEEEHGPLTPGSPTTASSTRPTTTGCTYCTTPRPPT